ncbi:Uma2 family endonuclease [Amycolatopsis sp. SID8362]|uniref:Uma2 family endonuclease n=1 Tax=Amycolatopsis sp. SID8362 TaxID=2690346 RepID=UPI001370A2CD|nr:Uma2 family endonuclease [Amycolatopsis sp. SID8362]NBH10198.1 Uma2 family endonuclease [Amycolatopsis sp. SID8362]NED46893.1 Uma2 family endonuclease [Amycolatopsis sp. SID8362]
MIHNAFLRPPRPDGWTVDDVLALPEEQTLLQRTELVDGVLLVSPWPGLEHQRLLGKLQRALMPALPDGTELLPGVNVRLEGQRLVVPDLVILNRPGADTLAFAASDVLLAAEIVSPSTKVQDRILKRAVYAEALIPFYLLVEPDSATLFELHSGDYEPIAKSDNGELHLTRPFEATLRL